MLKRKLEQLITYVQKVNIFLWNKLFLKVFKVLNTLKKLIGNQLKLKT